MHIAYEIKPSEIEWEMDWTALRSDGSRMYPDKSDKEMMFESQHALALLLMNEVIRINSQHWKKDWPEDARKATYLGVDCSDIFMWGCSDSEEINVDELKDLYHLFIDENLKGWGPTIWCLSKRREMPQGPIEEVMRDVGIDMDAIKAKYNLRVNFYDGFGSILYDSGRPKHDSPEFKELREQFKRENDWMEAD